MVLSRYFLRIIVWSQHYGFFPFYSDGCLTRICFCGDWDWEGDASCLQGTTVMLTFFLFFRAVWYVYFLFQQWSEFICQKGMFFCGGFLQDAHHSFIDREIIVDYNRQQLIHGWRIPRRWGECHSFSYSPLGFKSSSSLRLIFFFSKKGSGLSGRKESEQLSFGGRERPLCVPLYGFSLLSSC